MFHHSGKTKRKFNVGLMLVHRPRRWHNIRPTLMVLKAWNMFFCYIKVIFVVIYSSDVSVVGLS